MGNEAELRLAIRTVAVTTRVAVRSNRRTGHPEYAIASAQRGLALLDSIRQAIGPDTPSEIVDALETARRELSQLTAEGGHIAISVGDDGALPEDLDVRPKLRS